MTPRRASVVMAATAAVVLALDQATKVVVRATMEPGATVPIWEGVFHLTHVRNSGAAFGLLPEQRTLFIVVAVSVIVGIALYAWLAKPGSRWAVLSLGLIAGGSLGNLAERVVSGRVTDFLDPQVFPVFNIADIGIVVGTAGLVVLTLLEERRRSLEAGAAEEAVAEGSVADEPTGG